MQMSKDVLHPDNIKSKIIEFIRVQSAQENNAMIAYGDHCDWHDTCDCDTTSDEG